MGVMARRRCIACAVALTVLLSITLHNVELKHDHHHLVPDGDQITAALHGNERKFFLLPERKSAEADIFIALLVAGFLVSIRTVSIRRVRFTYRVYDVYLALFRKGILNTKAY